NGHESVAKLLLTKNDANTQDTIGRTPLAFAAKNGHEKVAIALLNHGSLDPDRKDHYCSTPLSIAVRNCRTEVVKALLATGQVAFDSRDCFGRTPLWWSRRHGSIDIEQMLLDYARKKGIPICHEDGPIETRPVSNDLAPRWCDVCTLSIPEDEAYYECGMCNGGDFDICLECYKIGGRCLRDNHQLVYKIDQEVS
ncbi:ankyrin repeat-containing domain protein, partial [Schizothecium vesticola]